MLLLCQPSKLFFFLRIKKSGSNLITKGSVLRSKNDLTWPFFNNCSNKFEIHAALSKFRISVQAASLNDRKDRRKNKFSPRECMLVVLSMQRVTLWWLVGIPFPIKKLNAAVRDKYNIGIACF